MASSGDFRREVLQALRKGLRSAAVLTEEAVRGSKGLRRGALLDGIGWAINVYRVENKGEEEEDDLDAAEMCEELLAARTRLLTGARVNACRKRGRSNDGAAPAGKRDTAEPKHDAASEMDSQQSEHAASDSQQRVSAESQQHAASDSQQSQHASSDSQQSQHASSDSQKSQAPPVVAAAQNNSQEPPPPNPESRGGLRVSEWDFERRCACLWIEGKMHTHERLVQCSPQKGPGSSVGAIFRVGDGMVQTRVRSIWWEVVTNMSGSKHKDVIRQLKSNHQLATVRRG